MYNDTCIHLCTMINTISLITISSIYELSKPMCHIMLLTIINIIELGNPLPGVYIIVYYTKHIHISDI